MLNEGRIGSRNDPGISQGMSLGIRNQISFILRISRTLDSESEFIQSSYMMLSVSCVRRSQNWFDHRIKASSDWPSAMIY